MEASTESVAQAEPVEEVTEPQAGAQTTPSEGVGSEGGDDERDESGRYLSREAASYRRRLRETEADRDRLSERVDRMQRTEVERLASAAGLAVAGDVWLHGATLETLRTDEGDIDRLVVEGLVTDLLRDRPGLQAAKEGDLGIGRSGRSTAQPKVGLSQLLKPGQAA
jgi:hypothetical protein